MNIAVCDDIEEYRNSINDYISEYLSIHHIDGTVDVFENGKTLLNSNTNYDILFLDIELGDTNGIDVAKEILKRNQNTVILIVTSYHQYLDDAMDINVTRYIDKPITKDRIFSSLDKAMLVINENIITLHMKDNKIVRIKLSDIVYVEAKLKRVTVYTKGESFSVKESLKQLRPMLSSSNFAVPHNSYIINLNFIKNFKRDEITFTQPYSNVSVSVATRKQAEFKRQFLDFIGEDCNND